MLKAHMADPVFPFTPFLTPNFQEIIIKILTRRIKAFFLKMWSPISRYQHIQPNIWFYKLHL